MKVVFRSGQSLHSMLTKMKDALAMESCPRWCIGSPAAVAGLTYVHWETLSRLETRVKEHQDACQKGALEN